MDAIQPEYTPKLLAGIDFDRTITSRHIHNILSASGETNPDKQWELVKHIKPINAEGEEDEWQKAFEELFKRGVYTAILTFSAYPHIIKRYLIEILKINPSFFDETKITIIAFHADNKNKHILDALKIFKLPEDFSKESIIFVDDDKKNTFAALIEGYLHVILATPSGKHIAALLSKVAELQKPDLNNQKENVFSSSSSSESLAALARSTEKLYGVLRSDSPSAAPDQELNLLKTSAENITIKPN